MSLYRVFITVILVFLVVGCHSITIRPEGNIKQFSQPDYQERKDFWFFGLVNEHSVDVAPICGTRRLTQMQAQSTFVDSLITALTFGIYTPRSVRVWCERAFDLGVSK